MTNFTINFLNFLIIRSFVYLFENIVEDIAIMLYLKNFMGSIR